MSRHSSASFTETRARRGTRAAERCRLRAAIVGVNLCLVRHLFSRLFTRPRQCRRRREGARVGPCGRAPRTSRRTHTSRGCSRFVLAYSFLQGRVSSSSFLRAGHSSVKECQPDEKRQSYGCDGTSLVRERLRLCPLSMEYRQRNGLSRYLSRAWEPPLGGPIIICLAYLRVPGKSTIDVVDYSRTGFLEPHEERESWRMEIIIEAERPKISQSHVSLALALQVQKVQVAAQ